MIEVIVKFGVLWLASSLVVGIFIGKMLQGSVEVIETSDFANNLQSTVQGATRSKAS